ELIATVWNGTAVSDETLTQRVALLRRALGDEAKSPRYLRAVRGRGYQIVPAVTVPAEEIEPAEEGPRRRQGAALAAAFGGLVAVGLLLVRALLAFGRAQARSASAGTVSTRTPDAQELVARAGSYLRQHQEADNELAIELYRKALDLE